MGKSFVAGLLLLFMMSIAVACSQKDALHTQNLNQNKNQTLNLYITKPEGQSYTAFKKIDDNETMKTVMGVLLNVSWENAKVSMSRRPDYKIDTINTDRTISNEPVTYAVWLSPKKDILEVIIEGQSKYGRITKEDSEKLLSILKTP